MGIQDSKSLENKERKDEMRREKRSSLRPEAKKKNGPRWWARLSASFIGPSSTEEEDRVIEEEPKRGFSWQEIRAKEKKKRIIRSRGEAVTNRMDEPEPEDAPESLLHQLSQQLDAAFHLSPWTPDGPKRRHDTPVDSNAINQAISTSPDLNRFSTATEVDAWFERARNDDSSIGKTASFATRGANRGSLATISATGGGHRYIVVSEHEAALLEALRQQRSATSTIREPSGNGSNIEKSGHQRHISAATLSRNRMSWWKPDSE